MAEGNRLKEASVNGLSRYVETDIMQSGAQVLQHESGREGCSMNPEERKVKYYLPAGQYLGQSPA